MYYKVEDFKNDWKTESEMTLKIFNNLTNESLDKKFDDKVRTPGRLAWHIVNSLPEMMNRTELNLGEFDYENSEVPESVTEIIREYKSFSEKLINEISEKWNDNSLTEKLNLYGEDWEKGRLLSILISHQIHHRAQLMVVMRLAGLKVPGIYGPAQEEWTSMGMEAQE